ncbi:hypothetical protein DPMN_127235 [Dreissena polymorpha]|uniref:Uncharacterized protein n=1 Tax=Dreissena polymorpha TaxID=45954 RepID=A0A9D4H0X2_DREPO|nr:hypothetical protein DPMN_127235 [Dreissena polymorpha]
MTLTRGRYGPGVNCMAKAPSLLTKGALGPRDCNTLPRDAWDVRGGTTPLMSRGPSQKEKSEGSIVPVAICSHPHAELVPGF